MEKKLKFNSIVKDVKLEKLNPLFTDAKVYVLYTGHNRNNSYFSKQAILDSLDTIYNIPVIGEYLVEKDNFGGHGGKLEISDNDIKYIQTTVPYGVVPSDVKVSWENVEEKDGTINEYLVLDGVKLWTSRYEDLNVLLEQGKLGQSMEIEIEDGSFSNIDGKETFNINKFIFSALCMLGVDKGNNPDEHVEPCFESSKIVTYSLDKDKFKREFNQLLEELNYSLKGGKKVAENTEKEFETTVETEVESQETTESVESTEEVTVETEVANTEEATQEFTEETQTEATTEVEEVVEESTEETTETVVEETVSEEFETTTEEVQTEDTTVETVEVTEEVVNVEETVNEFEVKYNDLSKEFETLKAELEDLRAFKRNTLEGELSAQFEGQLTSDELTQVFEQSKESSLEDIEKELYALVGKKNFSMMNEKPVTKIAVDVQKDIKNEADEPYGGLFSKFSNKK